MNLAFPLRNIESEIESFEKEDAHRKIQAIGTQILLAFNGCQ